MSPRRRGGRLGAEEKVRRRVTADRKLVLPSSGRANILNYNEPTRFLEPSSEAI